MGIENRLGYGPEKRGKQRAGDNGALLRSQMGAGWINREDGGDLANEIAHSLALLGGELGKRRVTAVFDAKRPDTALETIARNLDLRLLRATGYFVALVAW